MIAFADLKELLTATIRWEKRLKDFYDVAEYALQSRESRRAVAQLREGLLERLSVLEGIDVARFGRAEWVRFAPDYGDEEMVPVHALSRESTPQQLVGVILSCSRRLRDFYAGVAAHLISRDQKDLFQSLATFKDNQISQIERLLD